MTHEPLNMHNKLPDYIIISCYFSTVAALKVVQDTLFDIIQSDKNSCIDSLVKYQTMTVYYYFLFFLKMQFCVFCALGRKRSLYLLFLTSSGWWCQVMHTWLIQSRSTSDGTAHSQLHHGNHSWLTALERARMMQSEWPRLQLGSAAGAGEAGKAD